VSGVLGRALLLAGSTLFALLAAEGGARLLYEDPWYERLVAEQTEGSFRFRTSLNNLRDRDYASPKPAAHRRVLFLGDSFTVGQGVPRLAAIFPEIVERQLNAQPRLPGVERIDVLNGGLGASLTDRWLKLFQRVEDSFEPDVVIAVFFLRDGTETHLLGDFFGPIREEIALRNRRSSLYQSVYLYRLFRDRSDRAQVATRYLQVFQDSYFGNESETAEWRRAQENLLRIRDLAGKRSAVFGLVVFPVLADLDRADYPFGAICEEVESFARAHDIPVLSLLPAFRGRKGPDLWVSAFDQHPNERAHAIAAGSLLPFVRELVARSEEERGP
jgi:hypothetical protein